MRIYHNSWGKGIDSNFSCKKWIIMAIVTMLTFAIVSIQAYDISIYNAHNDTVPLATKVQGVLCLVNAVVTYLGINILYADAFTQNVNLCVIPCFLLSLATLIVRIITVGYAENGTKEGIVTPAYLSSSILITIMTLFWIYLFEIDIDTSTWFNRDCFPKSSSAVVSNQTTAEEDQQDREVIDNTSLNRIPTYKSEILPSYNEARLSLPYILKDD